MIKKIVIVKIESTEDEIRQALIGQSIPVFGKLAERYIREKEHYEQEGYEIRENTAGNFSFTAEKLIEEDD
ncbi:MAG: hypothetical protein R2780_01665 [Crocinitomicaceae bacterium]